MIFSINTDGYKLYSVAKHTLKMSEKDVYNMINNDFTEMVDLLMKKGIRYDTLKRALIPNQDKNNSEICLVFDSSLINSSLYGYAVFAELIPLLDKNSTYSILAGDYVDILKNISNSQQCLFNELKEGLIECNNSVYRHSSQYYFVYINNITNNQMLSIINGLQKFNCFFGYKKLNYESYFKTYLSYILPPICIKTKNTVIVNHISDYDNENVNDIGYPFEENGYKIVSINDNYFDIFLSYKIESIVTDKEDISFSFNALFPKFDSIDRLNLNISDEKWKYLNGDFKGKGGIVNSFRFNNINKDDFCRIIFKQICFNYIYNLRINEYGDRIFNVCIQLPTKNGNYRKTTVALKYKPDCGEIFLITIT